MPTPAEFLKNLGERFAPYDRPRVARIGCFTSLALLVLAIAAGASGVVNAHPFFPRYFRIVVLLMIGGALAVFAIFAAGETLAEKKAVKEIEAFLAGEGADLETLLEMARARRGRFTGSDRVIEILERLAASKGVPSRI